MPKAEVRKFSDAGAEFTIAGTRSALISLPFIARYRDEQLDQFTFLFRPASFATVREALAEKYPALRCLSRTLTNALGATFAQVECTLHDDRSVLSLQRLADSQGTYSALILVSKERAAEQREAETRKKKDI